MTIKIKSDKKKFFLPVPLWTGIINFALNLASKHAEKDREVILALKEVVPPVIKELKRFKRKHGKLVIVDITSADGEEVKITV